MKWREWKENWRWWHVVGLGIIFVPQLLLPLFYLLMALVMSDARSSPRSDILDRVEWLTNIMLFGPIVIAAAGLLWFALASPWFDSGDQRFTERIPPRRRLRILVLVAWMPALVMGAVMLVLLGVAIFRWRMTSIWSPAGLSTIWTWLILLATAAWGWQFGRVLCRRLIRSQQRARVCFNCAYSLAEIPNCQRCPECGRVVESLVLSSGPGEATDAVARP